jgi:lipopolysaccharide transport system ATP-binding protein
MQPSIIFDHVSKKFSRSYVSDSLRDTLLTPFKKLFGMNGNESDKENKEFWALEDVSFKVKPGEVLGIIGSNGSGKTTTLKLLSRILRPDGGQIMVNGRIGALIELGAGFNPDLTGRENIFLNAAILGMKREEILKKYDEIVEFAELEGFMDTPVKWYSSGMFARLGFAVAAHTDPQVLLVDEVLSVGDFVFQRKCFDKMLSFKQEGVTILFVSHNMQAVTTLCDRVVLLEKGNKIVDGSTSDIVSYYLENTGSLLKLESGNTISLEKGVVYNEHDIQSNVFKSGEKSFVEVCINFEDDFSNLYVTIFVQRNDGFFVFGVESNRFTGQLFSVKKGQKILLKVQLTLNLAPGEYRVGTSVFDTTDASNHKAIFREVLANIIVEEEEIGCCGIAYLEPVMIEGNVR